MNFWTKENLSKLKFSSNEELFNYLKIEASKAGFTLCSHRSLNEPYGRFYCSKGGRSNGSTNKCNCQFSFSSTISKENDQKFIIIKTDDSLKLQHTNHTLNVQTHAHHLLSEDVIEQISILHSSGISPSHIQKYLANAGQVFISTNQIESILHKDEIKTFSVETEDLINYMKSNDGICHVFELPDPQGITRIAVLTINQNELENLSNFGDVLFIDGTYASLELKWEVFPITAITNNYNICCCGIMYTALANEETLFWMLSQLSTHHEFCDNIQTLITDEDHSFINAFNKWLEDINQGNDYHIVINHILCALHKSRNFSKKLTKYGLNKEQREAAKDLFKIVCYNQNTEYVDQSLHTLQTDFGPRLSHYIEKHITPYLQNFSRAYVKHICCHGFNTTSPAESMNNLLKRSMKKQHVTLVESRIEFDRALNNHSLNCQIKLERARHKPLFENSHIFAPAILKKISIQIKIAENIELKQESDEIVLARHVRKPSVIYEIKDDNCSCGLCIFAGYPCCHIIKLYSEIGNEFPFHLISKRWIKYQIQENSSNQNASFFENDDAILYEEEEEEYFESDESNQFEFSVNDSETQTSRYLKILHKGKDLAKIASTDKMISNRVLKVLQHEINQILNIPTDSFDIDHINDMQNEEISENSPAHQENELIDRTYIEPGENGGIVKLNFFSYHKSEFLKKN